MPETRAVGSLCASSRRERFARGPSPSAQPSLVPIDPTAPVTILDVKGMPANDAIALLQAQGLVVKLELQPGSDATLPLFVVDQSPVAASVSPPGGPVLLKVVNVLP